MNTIKTQIELDIEVLGKELYESSLSALCTQKLGYDAVKKSREFVDKSLRKTALQFMFDDMICQAVDNMHHILDEEDKEFFLQLLRDGEITTKTNMGIDNYANDFFHFRDQ